MDSEDLLVNISRGTLQQSKKNLEPLFHRLAVLEQNVAASTSFALMGQTQFPMVPPGALGMTQPATVPPTGTGPAKSEPKEMGSLLFPTDEELTERLPWRPSIGSVGRLIDRLVWSVRSVR